MYTENVARVWDGKVLSEEFDTSMGVKQGCVLSTLLFILYINDIIDTVKGGITISGKTIPGLVFADDIVFLAETIDGLLMMINRLQLYCKTWNLSVNLSKSKIMILRNGGGRYSRYEKWTFDEEPIEIVKEYKYLGFLITSNLNIEKHLQVKLAEAKRAMCSVWRSCLLKKSVSHDAKYKIFRATAIAILFYGAQVWGYLSYEAVEKFLRYFIKSTFWLPSNSPNYMLHLETGIAPLFLDTLKLHFDYVVRVMSMSENRIPRLVLSQVINSGGSCVQEWNKLALECSSSLSLSTNENPDRLRLQFDDLLMKTGNMMYDKFMKEAEASLYRAYYSKLNHFLNSNTYFLAQNSSEKISLIFKVRGELIGLNYIPHRPELPILCDLCNLKVREDVLHFLGVCPILKEFRKHFFGVEILNFDEIISILNGERGWDLLYYYTLNASRYRARIVEENF